MTVQEAAISLFVALGGRGSNQGLLYVITQTAGDRQRFVVRMSEGVVIKTMPSEWYGFKVLYTGPGEGVPEFV